MSLRCVVGNCVQWREPAERHYWRATNVGFEPIEEHAYLDLCWFHSAFFVSQTIKTFQPGWDKVTESVEANSQ